MSGFGAPGIDGCRPASVIANASSASYDRLRERAGELHPPGAVFLAPGPADPVTAVTEELAGAADRGDAAAGDRIATIGQLDERSGVAAAHPQVPHDRQLADALRVAGVAELGLPGAHAEDRRSPARRERGDLGLADRSVPPAAEQSLDVLAYAPADQDVEPVVRVD